ncbi:MAG: amino acid adenylation domain-containing protein [Acidobacteriota bacterium]
MTTVMEPFGVSLEDEPSSLDRLAIQALDAYGLDGQVTLLSYAINATFAVETARERFALRLYRPETYDAAAIRSETAWLRHLAAAGERVAEPLPGTDGERVQAITSPEVAKPRHAVLFRWLDGSSGEDLWSPTLAAQLGETMARLHAASESFTPGEGFVRPCFGLAELHTPVISEEIETELLMPRSRRQLDEAAEALREELAGMGMGDESHGLIHGDLTPKNVLLQGGEISGVLDFTDCGSGPYVYDVAVSLQRLAELPEGAVHVREFLAGYRRVRPLAEEHERFVEAFQALHRIHLLRLLVRHRTIPVIRTRAADGFPYLVSQVERYVRRRRPAQAAVPAAETLADLTTVQLLAYLQERDVEVWNEDDRLRFSAPKGAMTGELRAELKRRKEELLRFLRTAASEATAASSLVAVPHEGPLPLSFAQERLWFLDRLEPGNPVYNLSQAMRFSAELDTDALERGLAEVVRRHAVLRTTFTVVDDQPRQVIHPELEVAPKVVDLAAFPTAERQARMEETLATERRHSFDLVHDAPLRLTLLRLGKADWVISTVLHHIAADGWSSGVLIRELLTLYQAFREDRPSPLQELAIQYADFAHWQRGYLTGEVLEAQLGYWKRQLDGAPQSLELPIDRPRARQTSYEGAKHSQPLPDELSEGLDRLCQEHGATLFMMLLAAFQALLARHTGNDDVVVGSPIANRDRSEVEGLIGFFVNTLVLRARLTPQITFRKLLAQVRETVVGAFDHQHLPFEKLVEELQPERSRHQNPLFQVVFAHQNVARPWRSGGGPELRPLAAQETLEPFEMTLYCWQRPEGFELSWHYRRALFDATTVRRMAEQLGALLAAMVESPDRPCATVALLSAAQRHQLLHDLNDVRTEYPRQDSVLDLFAAQLAATPDANALDFDDAKLSYSELEAEANRLAGHLAALSVRRGVAVGILVERSARMVVGFLAILKAGGAYVPLDPEYPAVRLAFMLEDTGAPVVLVEKASRERLARLAGAAVRLVCFDGDREAIAERSAGAPKLRLSGEDLAYVIYTSGSTGRPKGVAVPHRAIVRLVRETNYIDLGPSDRIAQLSNASFDAATFEIWGSLLNGASLLGVPTEVVLSPPTLAKTLREEDVTALFITVALFNQVARQDPEAFAGIRHVLVGGEAVDPHWVREVLTAGAPLRLLNVYGPTENTTFSTWHRIREVAAEATNVPIGKTIANSTLYVLDRALAPVPLGVSGELFLGGDGLAWGYLHRPALTAESFLPRPLNEMGGERLYRTGDLARRNRTGDVEFFGRIDHQVKLRGFRIELGEIEAALVRHPRVRNATVLIHPGATGEKTLVAWLAADEPSPAAGELRGFLRESLPDHMVPARFVCLDELPLTPNGKVNRKALATQLLPEEPGSAEAVTYGEPTEEILAGIWAELLGRRKVAVDENFFELGGHSLLAIQLMSRVRELFQVELPLQELFEGPTVAELARAVQAARLEALERVAPPLVAVLRDAELPLSFAQQRLWFFDQFQPGSAVYNVPSAVHLRGPISAALLEWITGEVVRRHEVLRTTFAAQRGRPRQVVAAELALPLPVIDLQRLDEARRHRESRRLADADADRPFDLAVGPLIRFALIALASEEHVVLVNMHHIVSDGWSAGIFLKEMATLYDAYSRGEPSPLPELRLQYADYAHWQRGWLSEEALDAELAFWKETLEGAPGVLELPTDRPRPAVQTFRGRTRPWRLPVTLTEELLILSQRRGATLFMTLLTAFDVLLGRWSGQDDIVVGTPIAGRHHKEVEDLIGFFVNTLVLRARIGGGPFGELVDALRRTALEAYAHQDLPFERLVEEIAPERDLSVNPVFQVMFALRHAVGELFRVPELEIRQLERQGTTAKFDLLFSLQHDETGVNGSLEYSSDLFDDTTTARLLAHYERLLEAVVADPERATAELDLFGAGERQQLLVEWNERATAELGSDTLHGLVAAQAERSPEAVALVAGDRSMGYGELRRRVNQLARYLRGFGVGPEIRVGICLGRDLDLVVAIFAVLEAGGAYVPLDPAYPLERVDFMVEDAEVEVIVTEEAFVDVLTETGATTLRLDTDAEQVAATASTPLPSVGGPENLAYVIYTSGSTGRPKGVAIEHRSAAALVRWSHRVFTGDELAGVAATTSVCFDLSIFELFVPLAAGGTVFLAQDALALPSLPNTGDLRLVNSVPSAVAELARLSELPEAARTINLAGEPLKRQLVDELRRQGVERVLNLYGPSEDTTYSTFVEVPPGTGEPTIGRPVDGTDAWVLDRRGRPVPFGVPGELHLGGRGLARGYLGWPERTAESFVPHPWSASPGGRLYRTGDLVRWRKDAELDFLGRADHQVKVRGFRIELGEIETTLGDYPGLREIVVHLWRKADDLRIIAYLVAEFEPAPSAEELRIFLGELLPEYMVPAAFVFLDELPRTPNGKVDRKGLPAPEMAAQEGELIPPNGPTEELLVGIWEELLGLERISAAANFFELGGHSLLATQVISRVREAFGVGLVLRQLFETPTVRQLAKSVESLRRQEQGREAPPIVATQRDDDLPLSFAQQRLWFLDQLEPDRAVYNIPGAVRLKGVLDVGLLERAFAEIVKRHESLRTIFPAADGEPRQVVLPQVELPFQVIDLRGLPEADREAEIRHLSEAEARTPFDLDRGPLFHIRLLHLAETDHVMLVTMHHIISDGWSMGVFYEELRACYAAFLEGESSPLAELPVQYADFAQWQRQWLTGEVVETEIAFWEEQLRDIPQRLDLPLDRPRPAFQTFVGRLLGVALPLDLSNDLAAMSRQRDSTLYMTLLAVFKILLGRHSRQRDIVVGSPVAGRNRREIEGLIGCFVNTLALRTHVGDDPGFPELLERVRQVALDAYSHQDLPFERLVEMVPERDTSASPLFQVMFTLQNAPRGALELPGLTLQPLPTDAKTSKFDLLLSLQEGSEGLSGVLEYNTDLFDETAMRRLLAHYEHLLEAILEDPERRLSTLPWWSPGERQQLLAEWNDGATVEVPADTLHALIGAQAARTPEATALVVGEDRKSYGELGRRWNRLAHELRGLGVGPEARVGVCLERDVDLVVAILGVLAAGGAYVPLDPAYPRERLAFMLEDADVDVIVTREALAGTLPEVDAALLRLDADAARIEARPATAPTSAGGPENLAYVIYTSGSTGRPKGVAIEHRSAAALVRWSRRVFTGDELAGVAATTSVCFDLSVFELFVPLAHGGTVILAENALALASLAAADEVRLVNSVPSAVTELAHLDALPETARTVNLAGEPLKRSLVDELRRQGVGRVLNLYGPSEDTTYSTFVEVPAGPGEPTIGRPVDGTDARVLDRHGGPTPLGVPGELFLGGQGLARGYLGRPARTAESFVPHPWSTASGGRLYCTGDLVRWRADSELEFLGRIDHQIKIRGLRIEPGEIEALVARHPAVDEVAVVMQQSRTGAHLVAFLVLAEGNEKPAEGALSQRLQESLPSYMVPAAFVWVEQMPQTPSGKIDRRHLAGLDFVKGDDSDERVQPRNPLELELLQIWQEVLEIRDIGVTDNFFKLGGHSLLTIYLMVCIRERLGPDLPVAVLFQAPTIETLAAALEQEHPRSRYPSLVPLSPDGEKAPFFCVHGADGNVFYFMELARHLSGLDAERPFYGIQARGLMGEEGEALRTVNAMAEYYLEVVRDHQPQGPYFLGGYSSGCLVAFEMGRRLREAGDEVAFLGMFDSLADPMRQVQVFNQTALLAFFARELMIPVMPDELVELEDDEQLSYILEKGWRLKKIPREFGFADANQALRIMEANLDATRKAELGSYPGKVTVFRSESSDRWEEDLGWGELAAEVETHNVTGNHRTMFVRPNVESLSELLVTCIRRAVSGLFPTRSAARASDRSASPGAPGRSSRPA